MAFDYLRSAALAQRENREWDRRRLASKRTFGDYLSEGLAGTLTGALSGLASGALGSLFPSAQDKLAEDQREELRRKREYEDVEPAAILWNRGDRPETRGAEVPDMRRMRAVPEAGSALPADLRALTGGSEPRIPEPGEAPGYRPPTPATAQQAPWQEIIVPPGLSSRQGQIAREKAHGVLQQIAGQRMAEEKAKQEAQRLAADIELTGAEAASKMTADQQRAIREFEALAAQYRKTDATSTRLGMWGRARGGGGAGGGTVGMAVAEEYWRNKGKTDEEIARLAPETARLSMRDFQRMTEGFTRTQAPDAPAGLSAALEVAQAMGLSEPQLSTWAALNAGKTPRELAQLAQTGRSATEATRRRELAPGEKALQDVTRGIKEAELALAPARSAALLARGQPTTETTDIKRRLGEPQGPFGAQPLLGETRTRTRTPGIAAPPVPAGTPPVPQDALTSQEAATAASRAIQRGLPAARATEFMSRIVGKTRAEAMRILNEYLP